MADRDMQSQNCERTCTLVFNQEWKRDCCVAQCLTVAMRHLIGEAMCAEQLSGCEAEANGHKNVYQCLETSGYMQWCRTRFGCLNRRLANVMTKRSAFIQGLCWTQRLKGRMERYRFAMWSV
jgi:hypothetical protein